MMLASILAQDATENVTELTVGGWIVMLLSVGFVTCLLAWCIVKVLREPDAEHRLHSSLDEPPDTREP